MPIVLDFGLCRPGRSGVDSPNLKAAAASPRSDSASATVPVALSLTLALSLGASAHVAGS